MGEEEHDETRDRRPQRGKTLRADASPSRPPARPHACVGCFGQTAMGPEERGNVGEEGDTIPHYSILKTVLS